MMKKTTAILLVILALCSVSLFGCNTDNVAPDGMKLATTDGVEYKMYVPQDWTVDISTGFVSAYVSESDRSNVSMSAFNLEDSTTTAKAFWDSYAADFALTLPDMEVESEDNYVLCSTAAYKCVYTASVTGVAYKFMQVVCPRAGYVYIFTYTALPDNYDANLEDVESVLSYVEF